MFVFEIETSDIYSVLGRVLDRSRVTGLKLSAVTAEETGNGRHAIAATVDTTDRALVERLARQFGGMVGVISVSVDREAARQSSSSAFAALKPLAQRVAATA